MKTKLLAALAGLNLVMLSGCVFKEAYPDQWQAISAVPGACPDIQGVFSDLGALNPTEIEDGLGEHYWETWLSYKFFSSWKTKSQ